MLIEQTSRSPTGSACPLVCSPVAPRKLSLRKAAWAGSLLVICSFSLSAQAQVTMGSIPMWNTNFMLNQQIVQMADRAHFSKLGATPASASDLPRETGAEPGEAARFDAARPPGEAAKLRESAHGYLAQLLGRDAGRAQVTAAGLVLN